MTTGVCRFEGHDHARCSDGEGQTWENPTPGAALVRADAVALPFGDETVDLVVTSPPYFALRSYTDGGEHYDGQIGSEPTPREFLHALWMVMAECWRVLKPSGSVFVNLGDKRAGSGGHNNANLSRLHETDGRRIKDRDRRADDGHRMVGATRRQAPNRYNQESGGVPAKSLMGTPWRFALGCTDGLAAPDGRQWILREDLIWSKPNGLPESVKDRCRQSHEYWFHFTKRGRYFADMDVIREPHIHAANGSVFGGKKAIGADAGLSNTYGNNTYDNLNPLGKLPDSVWRIPTQPLIVPDELGVDHFAAFPTEWPRRLIAAFCPDDGVVLDPFGGTGTTAMVARALGRFGVSMDLSSDYLRLANWRVFESDGAERVRARHESREFKPPKPEAEGQLSLLDVAP